jgi:hypothetical protein
MRNKGRQQTSYSTINGRIKIKRSVYINGDGARVAPYDGFLGIDKDSYSPGTREMCCRLACSCSFTAAQSNLHRLAQLDISHTTISRIASHQGDKIAHQMTSGDFKADFTHKDCLDDTVITGADGVMVPLVTDQQKRKRRHSEKLKRKAEHRKSTAGRGRPKKGSDGDYKEFKIVVFYSKDKEHKYAAATSENHKKLGSIMRREGFRIGIDKAAHKYSISDGAEWIRNQYRIQLPMLDDKILDYYHLQEHVRDAGNVLFEEGTAKSSAWRDKMMSCIWEQGSLVMLNCLKEDIEQAESAVKKKALESLRQYVYKRNDMTDYPSFREKGYDCGSGPTESTCGSFTLRLKGPGMKWDKDNAQKIMNLEAVHYSGQWNDYWLRERAS